LGSRKIEYADYSREFGVLESIKYRDVYQIRTKDDNGKEMLSNKISSRYCGIGRSEAYDYTDAIDRMRQKREKAAPIQISFGNRSHRFEDKDKERLSQSVSGYVTYEGAKEFAYDASTVRDISVYVAPHGKDAELAWSISKTMPVPEPSCAMLLLLGIAGLSLRRKDSVGIS
jgi:hypothetical protein